SRASPRSGPRIRPRPRSRPEACGRSFRALEEEEAVVEVEELGHRGVGHHRLGMGQAVPRALEEWPEITPRPISLERKQLIGLVGYHDQLGYPKITDYIRPPLNCGACALGKRVDVDGEVERARVEVGLDAVEAHHASARRAASVAQVVLAEEGRF